MSREVKSVRVIYRDGGQWEYAGSALNHVPPADRIALARELLAGTGKVVAREMEMFAEDRGQSPFERGFDAGWNEAVDAMLGDEG